jgi:putative phage-type endonuclease
MTNNYYVNIIDNLQEVLDKLVLFNKYELDDLNTSIYCLVKEYIDNNISDIIYYNFNKEIIENVYELLDINIDEVFSKNCSIYPIVEIKIKKLIKKNLLKIYSTYIPPRSYASSFIRNIKRDNIFIQNISKNIDYLSSIPQPEQRTHDWYLFRHNLITASSVWKIFKSDSTRNQLIYEKCEPYVIPGKTSLSSPLHWGQKYEPISVQLYEYLYNTKVGDFGCIQHHKYNFIGASPDGINIDKTNNRFGRMLEIKNIVNRVIDGIPKMEYWIQMQIQMETCDLNECDFLETQFVEYDSYNDYIADGCFNLTKDNKYKGIILLFCQDENLSYEYAPFNIDEEEYKKWENEVLDKNMDKEWIQNIYWKLEKFSNVLVLRNKLWFNSIVDNIKNIWEVIEYERVNGYNHRAPNKKSVINKITNENKCLINI